MAELWQTGESTSVPRTFRLTELSADLPGARVSASIEDKLRAGAFPAEHSKREILRVL